ncbi:MAG: DUF3467 domain-containing protein [Myxococcota bacterium]
MADPGPPHTGPAAQFFNMAQVRSTKREIFLDLMQVTGRGLPQGEPTAVPLSHAIMIASVVTTPAHAKALMSALKSNLDRYEKLFGTIEEPTEPPEVIN